MALTGRAALLAAARRRARRARAGLARGAGAGRLLVVLLVAGRPRCWPAPVRAVRVAARAAGTVRLGEAATVDAAGGNTGRAPVRGVVRDAWPPSAGARRDRATGSTCRPASGARVVDHAHARPGAATGAPTGSPSARSARSASPRGRRSHARAVARCGCCRRSRRASTCRRGWPGCASSTAAPRHGARPGHRVRLAARVRRRRRRPLDRLAGHGPARADVVVRTWRPERDRRVLLVLDTGRTSAGRVGDAPRLDAAMDAALLLAALAARAGDRVDLLAVRPRGSAPGSRARPAARCCRRSSHAMAPLEPTLVETDWRGDRRRRPGARAGQRSLVVLLTALDPAAARARACCRCCPQLAARHQVRRRLGRRPGGRRAGRAAAATPTRSTTRPPRERAVIERPALAAELVRGSASRSSTRPPDELPPRAGRPLPRPQGRRL